MSDLDFPKPGTHVVGVLQPFTALKPGDLLYLDNGIEQVTSEPYAKDDAFVVDLAHSNVLSTPDPGRVMLVLTPTFGGTFPW